jgi:hypothetical protein
MNTTSTWRQLNTCYASLCARRLIKLQVLLFQISGSRNGSLLEWRRNYPGNGRQQAPLKRRSTSTKPRGAIYQKAVTFNTVSTHGQARLASKYLPSLFYKMPTKIRRVKHLNPKMRLTLMFSEQVVAYHCLLVTSSMRCFSRKLIKLCLFQCSNIWQSCGDNALLRTIKIINIPIDPGLLAVLSQYVCSIRKNQPRQWVTWKTGKLHPSHRFNPWHYHCLLLRSNTNSSPFLFILRQCNKVKPERERDSARRTTAVKCGRAYLLAVRGSDRIRTRFLTRRLQHPPHTSYRSWWRNSSPFTE